ncbi:Proteasome subunit beta type-1 [Mycoemilia scoparia]|uniref:proteasome endopeptidase complex n=1 Tax=Mycoemilia scoparia TaxID=417184 RepID=A0A9W8A900_9FUNG|nr:Proteasome subunit beta type-1 [Mycoemilia scoparia]
MGLKPGEVSTGTTILAGKFKDCIIIGADSRTSMGTYIANRVTDKLTHVVDSIYCCRSGSAADTQAIAAIVKYELDVYATSHNERPTVKVAAKIFKRYLYENKSRLTAGIIVAGWDHQDGFSVYNLPVGGSIHEMNLALGGSGSLFIYGFCEEMYSPEMNREDGLKFIRTALKLAMSSDASSGGMIRTAIIDENGVQRDDVLGSDVKTY